MGLLRERARRLRGVTRLHVPTVGDPLVVVVVDEIASLTAYLADRELRRRVDAALGLLLSQGRAVGVVVVGAVQDPRKEVLPLRGLFPVRVALRTTEASQVDLVLGAGAHGRGATAEKIPAGLPGVGFAGGRRPARPGQGPGVLRQRRRDSRCRGPLPGTVRAAGRGSGPGHVGHRSRPPSGAAVAFGPGLRRRVGAAVAGGVASR